MTSFSLQLPIFNFQEQLSNGAGAAALTNEGGAFAFAMTSTDGASAVAAAGTGLNEQSVLGDFNQLDQVAGNQQQQQNPMTNLLQMFMQLMMMMLQLMMQMFGMNPKEQSKENQSAQNQTQSNQSRPQQTNATQTTATSNSTSSPKPTSSAASSFALTAVSSTNSTDTESDTNVTTNNDDLLSKIDPKELEQIKKVIKDKDLGELTKDGSPKYLIAKGGSDNKYHLYAQKGEYNTNFYQSVVPVQMGNNYLVVSQDIANKNKEAAAKAHNSASSTSGSETNNIAISMAAASDGNSSSAAIAIAISSGGGSSSPIKSGGLIENQGPSNTSSPLILDTNKDGQVEAQQGKGVDINGDGKADGAATGGDKMLAMGDLDGDGKITGKEVFGDQTVDPFTGQKINAKNGFDALNQVAQSAEQATGIDCIDDEGNVDVQKLKQALETSGKGSLGMISDDNVTKLESLGDVSKINTTNYKNQQQTGTVQHNQLGSYTDTTGNTNKIDDVWFKVS